MTAPLDEKTVAPSPSMEMEVLAWLHTLHMEHNQKTISVDQEEEHPYGESGEDFDPSYIVTSEPLVTLFQAQSALAAMKGAIATPEAVHANMMRGGIPKLSIRQALHLHGAEALARWDRAETAEARIKALEEALNWALGCGDDYRPRQDGEGPYWWRKELAERAGMTYDREAGIYRAGDTV